MDRRNPKDAEQDQPLLPLYIEGGQINDSPPDGKEAAVAFNSSKVIDL